MLVNGDHYTDSRGIPLKITGAREIVQQALLRLSIKKGSFACDPGLGSELYKLRALKNSANLERLALGYVREALLPMPELAVESIGITRSEPDVLALAVTFYYNDQSYQLEVNVQ